MARQRRLYLVIVHSKHVKIPTSVEMLSNPAYTDLIQDALKNCKKEGDVKKQISKLARSQAQTVTMEQVFLTDNHSTNRTASAEIIIDVDNRKVLKNRTGIEDEERIAAIYIDKYQDKIKEFNERFRK
jgi:hypothetical protein